MASAAVGFGGLCDVFFISEPQSMAGVRRGCSTTLLVPLHAHATRMNTQDNVPCVTNVEEDFFLSENHGGASNDDGGL